LGGRWRCVRAEKMDGCAREQSNWAAGYGWEWEDIGRRARRGMVQEVGRDDTTVGDGTKGGETGDE
jgi:hypothetical protein